MECTIGYVSELNRRGAAALNRGHVDEAFASFGGALEMISAFYRSAGGRAPSALGAVSAVADLAYGNRSNNNCGSVEVTWEAAMKEAKSAHLQFTSSVSTPHSTSPSTSSTNTAARPASVKTTRYEHDHFVYKEALVFNPSLVLSQERSTTLLPVCLAMIQFNLALAYQMKSKAVGEPALTRALYWYDLCLAQVQGSVHTAMPGYINIVVATMNNMAIVSHDLCHFDKARHIFGTLMELVSTYNVNERLQNFGEDDLQGVLLNIILLHADAIAPAA